MAARGIRIWRFATAGRVSVGMRSMQLQHTLSLRLQMFWSQWEPDCSIRNTQPGEQNTWDDSQSSMVHLASSQDQATLRKSLLIHL